MILTRVELSRNALLHNLAQFRRITPGAVLAPVVKANAYGHGMAPTAAILAQGGADWLCVNSVDEAAILRKAGLGLPLYVLGYTPPDAADEVLRLRLRIAVYDPEVIRAVSQAAKRKGRVAPLHLKLETGNYRQGLPLDEAVAMARLIARLPGVQLEGLSSHYADIEDTTDHAFASEQLAAFIKGCQALEQSGMKPVMRNFSNSAATILWQETQFELARIGISIYGMWPSTETLVSAEALGRARITLRPAMTWKTTVVQVKDVPAARSVGYGRTWRTTRPSRMAVLPVGYFEGYDRGLSNLGHVLINGAIAPIRGRVCMNMTMVDVTDIPGVVPGSEAVLLGPSGDLTVSAENLASWANTINYEITTRINPDIPRVVVD